MRALAVVATGKLFTLNTRDFMITFLPTRLLISVPVAIPLMRVTVPAVVIAKLRPARSATLSSEVVPKLMRNRGTVRGSLESHYIRIIGNLEFVKLLVVPLGLFLPVHCTNGNAFVLGFFSLYPHYSPITNHTRPTNHRTRKDAKSIKR